MYAPTLEHTLSDHAQLLQDSHRCGVVNVTNCPDSENPALAQRPIHERPCRFSRVSLAPFGPGQVISESNFVVLAVPRRCSGSRPLWQSGRPPRFKLSISNWPCNLAITHPLNLLPLRYSHPRRTRLPNSGRWCEQSGFRSRNGQFILERTKRGPLRAKSLMDP